ncbi:hypothetical protein BJ742DRAFT_685785 [Cladochytrium replicatum]|nr:hypothetical protein BJ742DRAFT_685785 [Cladochytrium replicatum]
MSSVAQQLHRHIPLIKFIGPRAAVPHPPLPEWTAPAQSVASPSSESAANGARVFLYDYHVQLPRKYQRKAISQQEIDAIQVGGPIR